MQLQSGDSRTASPAEFTKVAIALPIPFSRPGKGQSPEGFWALQMVRKTFCSAVTSRGKVLCARRGERPEVQRADLRERGFLMHTSARGAQADCWGRVGKEIFREPRACGFPPPPQSAPHTQATVGLAGPARALGGEGESRDR